MHTVASVIDFLEQFASPSLAADWDNVGLLLGDRASPVRKILTCLTVTPDCAAEAIELGAQLIVTHHPILFRGAKRLTGDTAEGRILLSLARAGVAVYSPHTAFDNTIGGINDSLAGRLGLKDLQPLVAEEGPRQCKLVVFVPDADLAKVSEAVFAAGAGNIGQYSQCSFRLDGTGTFFGSDATNPTVGQRGRREEVREWRLEMVCPEEVVEAVIVAMRTAHSYEEPAFDVYPLRPGKSREGVGRVGRLPYPQTLEDFGRRVRAALSCGPVQLVGEMGRAVERVAIVCGAGGELLSEAVRARADVFLTGEMRFHDYLTAQTREVALCLPGHYATERFALEELADRLKRHFPDLDVAASSRESDPVNWV